MTTTSRRERLRAELMAAIKAAALHQLEEGGPAAVSLRGIAREVGVSPAALYGYFDSLDDLFTALIADSYNDLADAVTAAVDAHPDAPRHERMFAGMAAYREWALANPARFRLCYFSPVPGYEAPMDGPTLGAALRVVAPLLALLADGWAKGELEQPPPGPPVDTSKFEERFGLVITSDQLRSASECWGEFHGLVTLELNGQIHKEWCDPDALYRANLGSMMSRMGLATP